MVGGGWPHLLALWLLGGERGSGMGGLKLLSLCLFFLGGGVGKGAPLTSFVLEIRA